MEETFRKFCYYFLTNGPKEELEKLKELTGKSFNEYKKKTNKFVKNLKRKTAKLGFNCDFESFCALLEKYIAIKDSLSDEEKKIYLKNLIELSQIYEVNLREELEQYVTVKEPKEKKEKELFGRMCIYNLRPETDVDEYNELKELADKYELDFNEIQKNSLMFTEEIKLSAEKLGFEPIKESIPAMIEDYLSKKKDMTDSEKASYLKVLFYLSVTFDINLRKELTKEKKNIKKVVLPDDINKKYLKENLTDPFEDEEVFSAFLKQRYQENRFAIEELSLITDEPIKESKEYDYLKLQADLTYKLYLIFLDKFNNYAYNDLNNKYLNLITEEELARLETLTREDIYGILKEMNKGEQSHYICNKYNLTNNLYTFILLSTVETTDLNVEHIGIGDNSLFVNNTFKNSYRIYLNGPRLETNLLINEYIRQCVENNLNYDMKALTSDTNKKRTTIYANKDDLVKKLNILNKLNNNYPELISKMGMPMYLTATLDNAYYSLSDIGLTDENGNCFLSYSDYINDLAEVAYYRMLAKLIVSKIEEESKKKIIVDFISLDNIDNKDKKPTDSKYNAIAFANIKELIDQYKDLINKALEISFNDENKTIELEKEFINSMKYLHNIIHNKHRSTKTNLALDIK